MKSNFIKMLFKSSVDQVKSQEPSVRLAASLMTLLVAQTFLSVQALGLDISYTGRLLESGEKPIEGPLDFTVKFYNDPTGGDSVGPTIKLAHTELIDGLFQLGLSLDNNQLTALYGDGSKTVYIEVEAGGKIYPRQRFMAVPLALRVPVDTQKLNYTNDGKLTIYSVDVNQISGLSAALAAKADASVVSTNSVKPSNNLSDLASPSAARTHLGLGGLSTLSNIGSTEITDGSVTNADINASAAIATSKLSGAVTAITGHGLGSLATASAVSGGTGGTITDDTITDTDINSVAGIAQSKIAGLTTALSGKEPAITTGSVINGGTLTTALQNGVQIKPFGAAAGNAGELRFNELAASGTNYVGFKAPDTLSANKIWTLPAADGTNGQILKTDGSGNLDWTNVGGMGTVTSVGVTAPAAGITVSGGPITGAGSITLALGDDLAAVEALSTTGGVERTGTNTWSTYTLTGAGKALIDDADATAQRTTLGLGALATASAVSGGTITDDSITDADINSAAGIAQSKIAGLSAALSGKEPTVAAGTTAQFYRGDKSWQTFDSTARSALSITAPLTYNSGTGVFGIGQSSGVADGFLSSSDFTVFNNKQAAISAATTVDAGTVTTAQQNGLQLKPYNTAAGQTGELRFNELAAGGANYVGFKAPDTLAGDKIWTLPAADGAAGQILKTDGSGTLGWVTGAAGSVTSVALTAPAAGITVSGGPITGAGSITLALGDDLAAVEAMSTTGGVERTGTNTWSTYTLTGAGKALIDDADATAQRTTLGLGGLATLNNLGSTEITDGAIMDADINASAAIATSKLSGAVTSIANHGLGSLATASVVSGGTAGTITDDSITDADINSVAGIAQSKIAGLTTDLSGKEPSITTSSVINAGTLTTALQNGVQIKPFGAAAGNAGELRFNELAASGTNYVGFKAPDTLAADKIWTLPAADGSNGQILKTDGSGTLGWVTGAAGSVTSVGVTAPAAGITVSGGPITGAGSITLALGDDLAAVEALSTTGGVERTGTNTWSTYTLTGAGKALIDDVDATAQRTTLGLGALATASAVSGGTITDDSITNADINSAAGIATSKLSGAVTSISGHGLGSLATLSSVDSSQITNGTIVDADISGTAAISSTKISFAADSISGNAIDGGIISNFQSMGIDDNATGVAMTLSSSGNVGIATTTPHSTLHLKGSMAVPVVTKAANYTLSDTDYVILANAASGAFTLTLPSAVGIAGRSYVLKKIDNSANVVTMAASASETIDNLASRSLSTEHQFLSVLSDGAAWRIVGTSGSINDGAWFPGSTILTSGEHTTLNTWIGTPGVTWVLCYRKSTQGASASTFHSSCNNRGPSVSIARLSNGYRIGGYLPSSWMSQNNYINVSGSFLFSLTNSYVHYALSTTYAGYDSSTYAPTFGGGHDWHIDNNISGGYANLGHSYACRIGTYGSSTCRDDFAGSYNSWTISELEVYTRN